jgi:type I restriction enzyme S subunit
MLEWKKLGDVCVSLRKAIIKQDNLDEKGTYPVINSGVTLYGRYNDYNNDGNAFTFASRGEYAGFLTYIDEKFWAGGLCYPYRSRNESVLLTKYIYSYLKNNEKMIMDTLVMRGGIPALNKADVEKILIPIPSLAEQSRIVGILDTFEASIANLEQQLEMRQKQYEYYRNKLLTFE